jgi:hypothetical protein
VICPKRNLPLANQLDLNLSGRTILESGFATLEWIVRQISENSYELIALLSRKGKKIFYHYTIQDIAVGFGHLQPFCAQFFVPSFEFLCGDFLSRVHRLHALTQQSVIFRFFVALHPGQKYGDFRAFLWGKPYYLLFQLGDTHATFLVHFGEIFNQKHPYAAFATALLSSA